MFFVFPARQSLEACNLKCVERNNRLVLNKQFVSGNRLSQIILHLELPYCTSMHALIENLITTATDGLGVIHRGVGVA